MCDRYILEDDGRTVREEPDLMKWATWFESTDRRVALAHIGPFRVSTVFLGLDHSFGDGPPLLFETMVFSAESLGEAVDEQVRYATHHQALAGHGQMVAKFRDKLAAKAKPSEPRTTSNDQKGLTHEDATARHP